MDYTCQTANERRLYTSLTALHIEPNFERVGETLCVRCRNHGRGQQADRHREEAAGDGEGGGGGELAAGGLRSAVSPGNNTTRRRCSS